MLERLRAKIVATVMAIAALTFVLAFVAIMAVTSTSAQAPLQNELKNAIAYGPDNTVSFVIGRKDIAQAAQSEAQGTIPVAVALVLNDMSLVAYNDAYLRNMDGQTRVAAVKGALSASSDTGLVADIDVFFRRESVDGGYALAFVDATAYLSTVRSTAIGTAAVFLCMLGALFALSIALARLITRPVQQAWDAQARFVADASHELKTPLTVILANTDILAAGPDNLTVSQKKWVEGIQSEGRRMKQLVEEMLFLARSDAAGTAPASAAPEVDLSDLVRQACLTFDAVAFEAGVELVESVQDGIAVHGEGDQLERLAKSLIDNAIKYAGRNGTVTVTLETSKRGKTVFAVSNTGEPIAACDLPHVFDRFWRSESARTESQNGSYGLGLAIAKSIAESQGARIDVESSRDEGTTFTVTF